MVRPAPTAPTPEPSLECLSRKALESFAEKLLGGRRAVTVQTGELARQGYDVSMLMDLVAEYAAVPANERTYEFEKDFGKLGSREDFGLHIRRV
jgi:hypothetical protein